MPRSGDFVTAQVTHDAPHHLVADSALAGGRFGVHRTRTGDLWEASQSVPAPGYGIQLGMPEVPVVACRRRATS